MALESKSKNINGNEYAVSQLPARQGFKLLKRLAHIILPAMGDGANTLLKSGKIPKSIKDLNLSVFDFRQIASLMMDRADESTMLECIDWMAENTLVNGRQLSKEFDVHFAGNMTEMLKWLSFAVEVNNPDLFSVLAENANGQDEMEKA